MCNPFLEDVKGTIAGDIITKGCNEDDLLVLANVISECGTSRGKLRLYHPIVQKVLFSVLRKGIVEELKAEAKESAEQAKAGNVAEALAKALEAVAKSSK